MHSSKIIFTSESNSKREFDVKKYELRELNSREMELQELVDSLYDTKKEIEIKQNASISDFQIDKSITENYPKAKEELRLFEEKVSLEVKKRIEEIEKKAYADGLLKAQEEGYSKGLTEVKEKVEALIGLLIEKGSDMFW